MNRHSLRLFANMPIDPETEGEHLDARGHASVVPGVWRPANDQGVCTKPLRIVTMGSGMQHKPAEEKPPCDSPLAWAT